MRPLQMNRLEKKTALIIGGASGIGKRIAERFVEEGACVAVADSSEENLDEFKKQTNRTVLTISTDVTVEEDVRKAVAFTVEEYGHLDIGVNSAGTGGLSLIIDYYEEQWDHEIGVCLKGTFLSVKHMAKQMIAQGNGGSIINMASLNARQPAEGMAAYCVAKAGVEMLTKVAAMELGPHKVRVNCLCPGLTETPLTAFVYQTPQVLEKYLDNIPLGRGGTVDDIASAAVFLASDEASWITAESLFVDGGSQTKAYPQMLKILADLYS
jgi:NAD(P)-dependent dehydrogenase (short-subunit alcohol dehydrogenase family)